MQDLKYGLFVMFCALLIAFIGVQIEKNIKQDERQTQQEKFFQAAANELLAQKGKVIGPKETKTIMGTKIIQWTLVSSFDKDNCRYTNIKCFYAFRIYLFPKTAEWSISPGYWDDKNHEFHYYYNYDIHIPGNKIMVNSDPVDQFYPEPFQPYKNEPSHSILLLLQKFVKNQKSK